jgi:hypothetical protein
MKLAVYTVFHSVEVAISASCAGKSSYFHVVELIAWQAGRNVGFQPLDDLELWAGTWYPGQASS